MIRPPLDPDPLYAAALEQAAWDAGYETGIRDSIPPAISLLIVAIVAAIVASLLTWSAMSVMAAAPRSELLPASRDAARSGAPRAGSWTGPGPESARVAADPAAEVGAPRLTGTATWYCSSSSACTRGFRPSSMVAAIDPTTGIRKGTWLTIRYGRRHIDVQVVDVCACAGNRVIDLTSGAFRKLAPLSAGRIAVSIEIVGDHAPLPATDR